MLEGLHGRFSPRTRRCSAPSTPPYPTDQHASLKALRSAHGRKLSAPTGAARATRPRGGSPPGPFGEARGPAAAAQQAQAPGGRAGFFAFRGPQSEDGKGFGRTHAPDSLKYLRVQCGCARSGFWHTTFTHRSCGVAFQTFICGASRRFSGVFKSTLLGNVPQVSVYLSAVAPESPRPRPLANPAAGYAALFRRIAR